MDISPSDCPVFRGLDFQCGDAIAIGFMGLISPNATKGDRQHGEKDARVKHYIYVGRTIRDHETTLICYVLEGWPLTPCE